MFLRKKTAGSTSLGHTWEEDGAVVEVPDEHGHLLLRILDGGFEVVDHLLHLDHGNPEADGAKVIEPGPASTLTEPGPDATLNEGGGEPQGDPDGAAGDGQTDGGEGGDKTDGDAAGDPPAPGADAAATPAKRAPAKAAKAAPPKTA